MTKLPLILALASGIAHAQPGGPAQRAESTPATRFAAHTFAANSQGAVALPAARGVTRPWRSVTLAAPRDAILEAVLAREGERVSAGDIVARLDARVARATARAAQADADRTAEIRLAGAELEQVRFRYDRVQQLADRLGTNPTEIENARLAVTQAEARLASAKENAAHAAFALEVERARLDEHVIRAPFSGIVTRVHLDPGAMRQLAEPILDLVQLGSLKLELAVPAHLVDDLELHRPYLVHAEAPIDAPLVAWLRAAPPIIDPATRTVRCVFEIDNRETWHPAGVLASLALDEQGLPVSLDLPASAEPPLGRPDDDRAAANAQPAPGQVGPPVPERLRTEQSPRNGAFGPPTAAFPAGTD